MSPTYAHLCHANRAAFGRKTAYASASCLVAFLSNLAFTKPGVFQVHITQGHGRNRRFSWQKRTQVEDFAPLGVASLGSKRFPTHGGRPKAAAWREEQQEFELPEHARLQAAPYGSSSCAICTAFRAAPLRIWSATTHMAKP